LASIIEKRHCLHRQLINQKQENEDLRRELNDLQGPANMGIASYMIAHEINNLLTPLSSYAELALRNPDDKALIEKALRKTKRNSRRASEIMESMLSIANGQKQERVSCKLRGLVDDVFKCLCRDFTKDGIKVKIEMSDDLEIYAVPVQIQQVFMNLILNARDSMLSQGGTLSIRAYENSSCVQIEIQDTGAGIEAEMIGKIFEPFFTTKSGTEGAGKQRGYGFGLAFCNRIIEEHNGSISVDSEPGKGTTFRIRVNKSK